MDIGEHILHNPSAVLGGKAGKWDVQALLRLHIPIFGIIFLKQAPPESAYGTP